MKELNEIKSQLARIEDKLDDHLERLAKAETTIDWLRGSVKVAVTIGTTIFTSLIIWLFGFNK